MNIDGKHHRTIWPYTDGASVNVIDQTLLPNGFATMRRANLSDAVEAIRSMVVRGAPTPCCLCFAYSESRTPSLQLKLDD